MQNKVVLKIKLVWAMRKCMVSIATRYMVLGGRPTKSIVSRMLLIFEH